jgi:hypothetical protein
MRGIGRGQTISLLLIPEVQGLMCRQLAKAGYTLNPNPNPNPNPKS